MQITVSCRVTYKAAPWTKFADSVADSVAEASEPAASCGVTNSEHAPAATLRCDDYTRKPLTQLPVQLDNLVWIRAL